jgi:phosphatidate phosphatase APP1
VPPRTARYVVISDIDDTVMHTGVAHKVTMLWRLFAQGARSRVAFPGVATFNRALHRGASGGERNPLLYVSRGSWGLYEVLDEFSHLHGIPVGPILFLREWGLSMRHPFPRRAQGHKLALIRHMLALYRDRPFILIGDSGQRDPEIYSVHLKSGCFDNASTSSACATLDAQVPVLEGRIDEAARAPVPFIVLGDFNRRFAQTNDRV